MTRSVGLKLDDTLAYDYGRSQTATNAEAVETSERAEHSGDRGQTAFSPGPQVLSHVWSNWAVHVPQVFAVEHTEHYLAFVVDYPVIPN